jgi:hypothetical protein
MASAVKAATKGAGPFVKSVAVETILAGAPAKLLQHEVALQAGLEALPQALLKKLLKSTDDHYAALLKLLAKKKSPKASFFYDYFTGAI